MILFGLPVVVGIGIEAQYQIAEAHMVYQATTTPVVVEEKPIQVRLEVDWTEERIDKLIEEKAQEYGVSASVMKAVVRCESHYDIDIQSHHRYDEGGREQSFGLAQIHLPAHPNVTYEEAIDPFFAIDFMAKHFAKGNYKMWTCWRMLYT